jgi:hypothetical protein
VSSVAERNLALCAATSPKNGQQPLRNPVPAMVTSVPPLIDPNDGATDEISGEFPRKVNASLRLNVSLPQERRTSTVPAGCGGTMAVIDIALTTATFVAGTPPKNNAQPATRFEPLMVTGVPPDTGPFAGRTWVSAGVVGAVRTSTKNVDC